MEKSSVKLFLVEMLILKRAINLLHKSEKLDMDPSFKLQYQVNVEPLEIVGSILHMALES